MSKTFILLIAGYLVLAGGAADPPAEAMGVKVRFDRDFLYIGARRGAPRPATSRPAARSPCSMRGAIRGAWSAGRPTDGTTKRERERAL